MSKYYHLGPQVISYQLYVTHFVSFSLSQVTSLEVLNTLEERSLLLTASRDGCVRVWQNYDCKNGAVPQLLSSW